MTALSTQQAWERYREKELVRVKALLRACGYVLDDEQPHIGGERFLMQALTTTSGKKLILLGQRETDGVRAIIKATSDADGARELTHERRAKKLLSDLKFAYDVFHTPEELLFFEKDGLTLSAQRYIPQSTTFLARPLREQFSFALAAFKAQEGARATTEGHLRAIRRVFPIFGPDEYLHTFETFLKECGEGALATTSLIEVRERLSNRRERIEQYCGFLTHTDFVPHNFRIEGTTMYLLDHSSLRFGNKHEGWARFMNFMTLYNPELDDALTRYVGDNRAPEEYESLALMRLYRLGEIIAYYTRATRMSEGALHELNTARIDFWHTALAARLSDTPLAPTIRTRYMGLRDRLRSEEEKRRQTGLH